MTGWEAGWDRRGIRGEWEIPEDITKVCNVKCGDGIRDGGVCVGAKGIEMRKRNRRGIVGEWEGN